MGAKGRRRPRRENRITPFSHRPRSGWSANPGTCPQGDRRAGMAVRRKSRNPVPPLQGTLWKFLMRQPWPSTAAPLTLSSVFSNLLSVIRFLLLGFVSAPIMENRMAFFKPSAPPPKTSCKQPPGRPASALGRAGRPGDRSQLCTRLFHATRCKHTHRQLANSLRLFTS